MLFDFNTAFCQLLSKEYGVSVRTPSKEWPTRWEYPTLDGYITKEQDRAVWKKICSGQFPGFWETLPHYSWSTGLLKAAAEHSRELYFITSRCGPLRLAESSFALADLAQLIWLDCEAFPSVIPVDSHERKLPIINALGLTHYVDDRFDTMSLASARCLNTRLGLWSQPWNQQGEITAVTRLTTVEDFEQWLS